ncbi:MAG: NAD(P)-dependent alcohol dehydrogenase [Chloroflexota bacterium]
MKAIVYEEYGPPEVLQLKEMEKPTPKDDEVLIKIHATSVILGDCEFRSFSFPYWFWLPLRLYAGFRRPKRVNILGQELAGEVEAVGKNVTRFQPGDSVFGSPEISLGAYAEYTCLREDMPLAPKPANMTYAEAATVPTGGLNALHYIRKANIQRGDNVLINGAAGNIGSFAVQLAKHFGAEVTAVDSTAKLEMLRSIGADHVIDYTQEDFTKNGVTYDVIFDVVGKSAYSRSLKSLAPNGCYLLANPKGFGEMIRGAWTSRTSSQQVSFAFSQYTVEDLDYLRELIESDVLKAVIDRTYPLEQMVEAHRYVDSGQKIGNIAIIVTA